MSNTESAGHPDLAVLREQPSGSGDQAGKPSPALKRLLSIRLHRKLSSPLKRLLPLLLLGLLAGCPAKEKSVPVSVTGYNHNEDLAILGFSVNGASGPNLGLASGGGKYSCCIGLPKKWKPGMTATVHWQYGTLEGRPPPPPPQSATVEIPEYTPKNMGPLQVHFYPDHRIKVVSSRYLLGHPYHPLPQEDWYPWTLDEAFARNQAWAEEQERKKGKNER